MSPECSLSGPPSIRNANMNEVGQSEDIHGHLMHNGDELSGKFDGKFEVRFLFLPSSMFDFRSLGSSNFGF